MSLLIVVCHVMSCNVTSSACYVVCRRTFPQGGRGGQHQMDTRTMLTTIPGPPPGTTQDIPRMTWALYLLGGKCGRQAMVVCTSLTTVSLLYLQPSSLPHPLPHPCPSPTPIPSATRTTSWGDPRVTVKGKDGPVSYSDVKYLLIACV